MENIELQKFPSRPKS